MIRRIVRLTFRMHRFEVGAVVILGGLLVVGAILARWALANVGLPADCVPSFETGELPPSCVAQYEAFYRIAGLASPIATLMVLFPTIAGLLIGAPVMAREIERGTTSLAWSLSPSRFRWFLHRVVPMALLLVAVSYSVGVAADHLAGAVNQQADLTKSFTSFRFRGVLIATQAFLLGSTAIAVGALFGRAVPTFLLALIIGILSILAVGEVHKQTMVGEGLIRSTDDNEAYSGDNLLLGNWFQLPDGRLLTFEELVREDPTFFDTGTSYPTVVLIIPGERYRTVEAREAVAHVAIGLLFLVGGAFVVTRRRPT